MEFISGRHFTKQRKQFLRANDKRVKVWNYLQKTLDLQLNTKIIRQAHGLMMEDEKVVLAGKYRKSLAFAGYHIFVSAGHIERYMEDAIFKFYETKKICLETLSIYIHLKMGMEESVARFWLMF